MIIAVVPQKVHGAIVRVGIVGFVAGIWISAKKPKLATTCVNINHVIALRILQMAPDDTDESRWRVTSISYSCIAEPTVVCAVLDTVDSTQDEVGCLVTLSGDSTALASDLETFARVWPELSVEGKGNQLAGLYAARGNKGRKKRAVPDAGDGDGHGTKPKAAKKVTKKKGTEKKKASGKSDKAKGHGVDFKFGKKLKKAKEMITIKFAPENLVKNKTGKQLIQNAMNELRALDNAKFAGNTAFSKEDHTCNFTHPSCNGVPWSKIEANAYAFFKLQPFACTGIGGTRWGGYWGHDHSWRV